MDSSGCGIAFFDSGHGFKTKEEDIADEEKFVEGCKVLRLVAQNKLDAVAEAVDAQPFLLNFRDYDRRTPLHIAASEGHVDIVEFLTSRGARVNRSDRWGGSPLDDALRHRHRAQPREHPTDRCRSRPEGCERDHHRRCCGR